MQRVQIKIFTGKVNTEAFNSDHRESERQKAIDKALKELQDNVNRWIEDNDKDVDVIEIKQLSWNTFRMPARMHNTIKYSTKICT